MVYYLIHFRRRGSLVFCFSKLLEKRRSAVKRGTMEVTILISILAGMVVLLLIVWSFSSDRYGALRPSKEVTDAFETFRVDLGKEYYLSGPDVYPNAVIGIDKSRALVTDLWKKTDLTTEKMKELVGNMHSKAMEHMAFLQGFDILDDRGAKIGEWFSLPGMSIVIRMKGEDRVSISTPPLDVYPDR
jgi:hypothetical protein